jgi:hypothetical protein
MDAKDGVPGGEIAQGLDGVEAEDEALDEVFEERFGLFVLGAVGFEPFMVIVQAKGCAGKRRWAGIGSWDRLLQPGPHLE